MSGLSRLYRAEIPIIILWDKALVYEERQIPDFFEKSGIAHTRDSFILLFKVDLPEYYAIIYFETELN